MCAPVCTLPTPTSLLSGTACFSQLTKLIYTFLLEVMSRAVCHAVFQAGLPIFNIRQPERTMLVGRERQTNYGIAGQGMPLQLSLLIAVEGGNVPLSLKPRHSLSFPSCCGLLCSSENSMTLTPPAAITVFLSPQHPPKQKKKKIQVLSLTKILREHRTSEIEKSSLAPKKSKTYLKREVQAWTVSSSRDKYDRFLTVKTLLYTWDLMSI